MAMRVLTGALLVVGGVFVALTFALEPGSRAIPFAVGCAFESLLLVQFVRELRDPVPEAPLDWRGVRWVLVLGGATLLIGAVFGPALFVALYARRTGRERWLGVGAASAATALAFWLVTTRVLGVPMPLGAIGALVAPLGWIPP